MEEFNLTDDEKKYLLNLARFSICKRLDIKFPHPEIEDNEKFSKKIAVFVTLKINDELRGCIGHIEPSYPLYKAVEESAISAAFNDPRFPKVSKKEINDIKIEISLLSPLKKIKSHQEIKPFVDGVYIKKGYHSGLFLPQVWKELPDKKQFMNALCSHKAWLPEDEWKKGSCEIFVFQVLSFSE